MALLSGNFSRGTTIVIIRTPDAIYAAADSKIVSSGSVTTEHKIRFEGETGYALAGLFEEPTSGFDLIQIVKGVCSSDRPVVEKFAELEAALRARLITAMNNIYHHPSSPGIDHPGVQVALFGVQGKTPYVFRLTLDAVANDSDITDVRIRRLVIPDGKEMEPYTIVFLAQSQEILATLQSIRLRGKDWRDALCQMIQLAIEKNPSSVGPPVDIVEVTSQGRRWLQRKNGCPD